MTENKQLRQWLRHYGMPEENIDNCITQIVQGYGACRYLDGVAAGADAVGVQTMNCCGKCCWCRPLGNGYWCDKIERWVSAIFTCKFYEVCTPSLKS